MMTYVAHFDSISDAKALKRAIASLRKEYDRISKAEKDPSVKSINVGRRIGLEMKIARLMVRSFTAAA